MRKKALPLLLILSLSLSVLFPVLAAGEGRGATFSDVSASHWAFSSIEELVERKAINGYPDGKFYPDKTVSREEFAKIMVVAAGLTAAPAANSSYADVPLTYWASPYIETARPYMTAYQNQGQLYFHPSTGALREDIAVAVVKLKGYDTRMADISMLSTMFQDLSSISEAARPYVALAVEHGIITGYTDGTFRGQGTITRAEAAAMLWRAFQEGSGTKVIPDDILPSAAATPTPAPTPTRAPERPAEVTAGLIVEVAQPRVQIISADGTKNIYSVEGLWDNWIPGDLVLFEELADGSMRILERGVSVTAGYDKTTETFNGLVVGKDCPLFAEVTAASTGDWGSKYKAYSLRDMRSIPAQRGLFLLNEKGQVAAVYMDLEQDPTTLSDVATYGIVTAHNGTKKVNDEMYFVYQVGVNEELYDVYVSRDGLKKGDLVSFRETFDSCYSLDDITVYTPQNTLVACAREYNESAQLLTLYTDVEKDDERGMFVGREPKSYTVSKDCAITYVDRGNQKSGDEIGLNPYDTTTGYKNIAVILDENDMVTVIFVETSGECDILP